MIELVENIKSNENSESEEIRDFWKAQVLLILWKSALGKIFYTAYAWSSTTFQSYFAVIAHQAYLDDMVPPQMCFFFFKFVYSILLTWHSYTVVPLDPW